MTEALRLNPIEIDEGRWKAKAACKGLSTKEAMDLFFPTVGQPNVERVKKRKALCNSCPVGAECLEHAVLNGMVGIWNNTSAKRRRTMEPDVEKFGHRYSRPYVPLAEDNNDFRKGFYA